MNTLLDMATRDLRYADFLERIGERDNAEKIRAGVAELLRDAPHPNRHSRPVLEQRLGGRL